MRQGLRPWHPIDKPRVGHAAALLADGRVLITGGAAGATGSGSLTRSAEIHHPATGTFAKVEVEPAVLPSAASR